MLWEHKLVHRACNLPPGLRGDGSDLALVEGKVVCKQGLKVGWKGSDAKSTALENELSSIVDRIYVCTQDVEYTITAVYIWNVWSS